MTRLEKKYLAALDPSEEDSAARWPAAMQRRSFDFGHPVAAQFLDDRTLPGYLDFIRRVQGSDAEEAAKAYDFEATLPPHWRADVHPLVLSEFLAYKSALAYRDRRTIEADLLGRNAAGRRYADGIDGFEFFDTSSSRARYVHGDTQGFAFVRGRCGYVIMRGTESFADLATDFYDEPTTETFDKLDVLEQKLVGRATPLRHTGFALAWGAVAPDVDAWVDRQQSAGAIDHVVLTGHSLGGALALLGALHLARRKGQAFIRAVVTFGAPMTGGQDFRDEYEKTLRLEDRTLRIEADEDLVSLVTRRFDTYKTVGHAWRFAKRPARPTWQMILFSPLVEAAKPAGREAARVEAKREQEAVRRQVSKDGATSNRTWGAFVRGLVIKALWFVVKLLLRAWAAHSMERRYGLYLSTLVYRRLRAYHMERAELEMAAQRSFANRKLAEAQAYEKAYADLSAHLRYVRGRHPRTFRALRKRPIRISSEQSLAWYERYFEHYIA